MIQKFENGARVQKRNSIEGDPHKNGDKATIIASYFLESDWDKLGYLVVFDDGDNVGVPILIAPHRIEEATD